jgi:hypothetical protein
MGSSDLAPDWVIAEMPPGYGTRIAEIRRLTQELEAMDQFARLLYDRGPRLAEAVHGLIRSMDVDAELVSEPPCSHVVVRLDPGRRLILHVAADEQTIHRKSAEIAHVFQILHEAADDYDRVVLVTNTDPGQRPAERSAALAADAEEFLTRMRVAHVPASAFFTLWKLSLQDRGAARQQLMYLHAHEGGTFDLAGTVLLR